MPFVEFPQIIGLVFGAASITYAGWSLATVDAAAASEENQNRIEDAENDAPKGEYQQVDEVIIATFMTSYCLIVTQYQSMAVLV
jgi:hypothetical protein